jgi:hypothetical protein
MARNIGVPCAGRAGVSLSAAVVDPQAHIAVARWGHRLAVEVGSSELRVES